MKEVDKYWNDFFDNNKVISQMECMHKNEILNINENTFKIFSLPIISKPRIIIIGQDPYMDENITTGIPFEVKNYSWTNTTKQTSIINILKCLYYRDFINTPNFDINDLSIDYLRGQLKNDNCPVLSAKEIFPKWFECGTILLNLSLTNGNKPGEHIPYWKEFTKFVITYIIKKEKKKIDLFLLGKKVQNSLKDCSIYDNVNVHKVPHPASGNTFLKCDKNPFKIKCLDSFLPFKIKK